VFKYVTVCHSPCYLKGSVRDTIGDEGLIECWAMRDGVCVVGNCTHSYKEHMHIYYDSYDVLEEVVDTSVKEMVDRSISAKAIKEQMIKKQERDIEEMNKELGEIKQACVKFACFLKLNAITPYNDAMAEYLNHLIKEERDKVSIGGSDRTLNSLEATLIEYHENTKILETSMSDVDSNVLDEILSPIHIRTIVHELYMLEHSGSKIKEALDAVVVSKLEVVNYQEVLASSINVRSNVDESSDGIGQEQESVQGTLPYLIRSGINFVRNIIR